ncbi:unnamed protein product [Linum trigynum]|uniref:Stress enhanced protein 2 n=1 Tax=Linum trigynum TaxID=586398 RepID=A0AAV2E2U7_9ROSI
MATATSRVIRCDLGAAGNKQQRPPVSRNDSAAGAPVQLVTMPPKTEPAAGENGKIMLQPRLCTLRSYGDDRFAVVKTRKNYGGGIGDYEVSPFFETLSEYIESSKKSQDFETISGRVAMIVFAATVAAEVVTGNSVVGKLDLVGIEEAGGACLAAVVFAAAFAWVSSARNGVGKIFTSGCNYVIDSLVDDVVDGLFYDTELSDWSDEV